MMKKTVLSLMPSLFKGCLAVVFLATASTYSYADKLLYYPVNPSFGGSPLNGSVLLGEANAQNSFKDPSTAQNQTFQDKVDQAIQNRIISAAAGNITDSKGNLKPGSFDSGSQHYDITTDGVSTTTVVTDTLTGAKLLQFTLQNQ